MGLQSKVAESTPKERPILFSGEMVRAIMDGQKTQTRRLMRPQQKLMGKDWTYPVKLQGKKWPCLLGPVTDALCPYGQVGDRLWVREAWGLFDTEPKDGPESARLLYRQRDEGWHWLRHQKWRPSIHMPRWASRITLDITHVHVEQLQDIQEYDAMAEGVAPTRGTAVYPGTGAYRPLSYRDGFALLWDKIHGKGAAWASDPWVWVVEFRMALSARETP